MEGVVNVEAPQTGLRLEDVAGGFQFDHAQMAGRLAGQGHEGTSEPLMILLQDVLSTLFLHVVDPDLGADGRGARRGQVALEPPTQRVALAGVD